MRGPACALLALGAGGCFAPVLRPVEMADLGQLSLTAGALFPDANANVPIEASAVAAVGIAPHLQLELSGAIDGGDGMVGALPFDWSAGVGLRGAIPLVSGLQLQIAGLYDWLDGSLTRENLCGEISTSTTSGSRETLEVGPTYELRNRILSVGAWLQASLGQLHETAPAGQNQGPGLPFSAGLRFGLQIHPWPEQAHWLSGIVGLAFGVPLVDLKGTSTTFEDSSQFWTAVGLALNATF
ncbi:MAG: hypothetical protein ACYDCL_04135 [Myxococcales bacterium]